MTAPSATGCGGLGTGLGRTAGALLRPLLLALVLPGLPAGAAVNRPASAAVPYEADIRAFEAADLRSPPPPDAVLFVGSSTITRWTDLAQSFPEYTVLNRGFGGSQLSDVLNHFDRAVRRYAPPLIVLYEGDNDLSGGKSVERVFADWTNFVGRVERELPGTGVVYLSVKPSPSRVALLEAQRALNARIAADCVTRPRCRSVDILSPMLDAAGKPRAELFVSDMLHLNPAGYAIVTAALRPVLEAWAVAHPERSIRASAGTLRVDFGSPEFRSGSGLAGGGAEHWNNINATVGGAGGARVSGLVTADGTPTTAAWETTSRFNGANSSGTTATTPFPSTATRDSLFGNTEAFGGLANLTPAFRITGLRSGVLHRLTFYASRLGSTDNRETRYTVSGRTTATADLDAANNIATVALVAGIEPDPEGAVSVALAPGPRNNNANHFVYLGVLRIAEETEGGRVFLFDLGAADAPTGTSAGPVTGRWNDLTPEVGTDPAGVLAGLVASDGAATSIALRMVSRFNGVNLNGTTASAVFPASATRDALFGNTETFDGLSGVTPAFRLTGLDSGRVYSLGFHASRTGVTDRRETRYAVSGRDERSALLDASNNTNGVAWVTGVVPDAAGQIEVRLEPGPANDNANHFTYLGALQLDWRETGPPPRPTLALVRWVPGGVRVRVSAGFGRACRIERSRDLTHWTPTGSLIEPGEGGAEVEVEAEAGDGSGALASAFFLRAIDEPRA
jgi:hypothetical protein